MRTLTTLTAGALACGSLLAVGDIAAAQGGTPTDPAAEVVPATAATSTVTLPLLGAPLVVDVSTDAGGGLVDVALNQADDYTAEKIKSNRVAFVSNTEGTEVRVASKWGGERVTASAASLTEISGPGGWNGDVFGTGQSTNVAFNVGATADGGPDITGIAVDSPAEATIGDTTYDERSRGDKTLQSASATVEFAQNGQTRSLVITATVSARPDGTSSDVIVGLSGVRGRAIVEGEPVGTHTWSGVLCDGTAASVTYTVDAEGILSDIVATPEAQVRAEGGRAWVAFSGREGVWVSSGESRWGDDDNDELAVGTAEWFKCDRVDPTVNTDVDPDAYVDDWRHGDWKDGDHRHDEGWKDGDRKDDGWKDHDRSDDERNDDWRDDHRSDGNWRDERRGDDRGGDDGQGRDQGDDDRRGDDDGRDDRDGRDDGGREG